MKKYTLLMLLLLTFLSFAQYEEAFKKVREATNIEGLKVLQQRFSLEQKDRDARLDKYFTENPTKQKRWEDGEITFEIYDVVDGVEQIVKTANHTSAITSRTNKLYNGGGLGLNVQGQGMTAFVWDNGSGNYMHQEFPDGKVLIYDFANTALHATHVIGTIVALGVNSNARGLAFNASCGSYDWNGDLVEMAGQVLTEESMLVSNHSYTRSPNPLPAWFFGAYASGARDFDEVAFNAPYYLPVVAAGNSRNDLNNASVSNHLAIKGGYDLIFGFQTAKNILTVGAVKQVLNYTTNWDVEMTDFSSWGPTDDGRIKPDLVAKGFQVFSTSDETSMSYRTMNGTSMASPAITASALLLQQHYQNTHQQFMKAATLKGLLLHTTDEAGTFPGPDYEFGWGLANAERAANLITNTISNNSRISELSLNNGQTITYQVRASGNAPLTASISWTDTPASANNGIIDDPTLKLINDLDIRITNEGQTFFPWTLNPDEFWGAASNTQDNFRDNYERIDINNPIGQQIYTIVVSHKNSLSANFQNFSLIVSGINQILSSENVSIEKKIELYPVPANNLLNINNLEINQDTKYSIFNLSGQLLLNGIFKNNSNQTVDISNLSSGVYFIKLANDNKIETLKFSKK